MGESRESARVERRDELLAAAREAAMHAYAPYSHFRVGAAVLLRTPDGERIVTGANVENASYGLALCAERAALAAAVQHTPPGTRPAVLAVAIAGPDAEPGGCMPCGACRQWLAELAPDAVYYVEGAPQAYRLDDLLPHQFSLDRSGG